jgi:hypothetical protein
MRAAGGRRLLPPLPLSADAAALPLPWRLCRSWQPAGPWHGVGVHVEVGGGASTSPASAAAAEGAGGDSRHAVAGPECRPLQDGRGSLRGWPVAGCVAAGAWQRVRHRSMHAQRGVHGLACGVRARIQISLQTSAECQPSAPHMRKRHTWRSVPCHQQGQRPGHPCCHRRSPPPARPWRCRSPAPAARVRWALRPQERPAPRQPQARGLGAAATRTPPQASTPLCLRWRRGALRRCTGRRCCRCHPWGQGLLAAPPSHRLRRTQ